MTNRLVVLKDINGNVFYGLPFSNNKYRTTLSAGVAQSVTVPGDAEVAIFSYGTGGDVYVDPTTTATLPGGAFASTTADLNPVARQVTGNSTLSCISATTCDVHIAFYTLLQTGNV